MGVFGVYLNFCKSLTFNELPKLNSNFIKKTMEDNLIDEIPAELTKTQQWQVKQAEDYIKVAEWMLYGLAGINFAYLFLNLDLLQGIDFWISIAFSLIYILAAIGTRYKPLLSIGCAFLVYLFVHVVSYFINPDTLFSGLLWKIIIIIFFSAGTFNAFKIYRIKNSIK
jgi:hypothetical protein